jgi:hypothetical protein
VQLLSNLLPEPVGLQLVGWEVDPAQAMIALTLRSQQTTLPCPRCRVPAKRLHSQYQRTLADLPWGSWSVKLGLGMRKLFCDNPHCGRRIFTERLPGRAGDSGGSGRFPGWLPFRAESRVPAPEGVLPFFVEHPGPYLQ